LIMENSSSITVIIAGKNFAPVCDYLKNVLPEISLEMVEAKDLIKKAEEAQIIFPAMARIDEKIFKRAPSLRLVQQWGTGLEGIDIGSATRYRVAVANVPTAGSGNAESVAEWYVMAALCLSRKTCEIRSQVRKGYPWGSPLGQALYGRTAGIIGFGGIGKALALLLKTFNMKILVVDKKPDKITAQNIGVDWIGEVADLLHLLKKTEYLFICIPLTAETKNMISQPELALLPKGAFILNAARGSVINQQALMQAMDSKHLGGVALDVYWEEPPKPNDPILDYPNILATPHIAGVTDVSYQGISIQVKENIIRVMKGKLPLNCANPEVRLKDMK